MEIEINSKKNNPLLKRTEIYFTIKHAGGGTPNREIIRSELADKLNSKKESVILNIIKPGFGVNETTGYAKIYSSLESLKGFEREHILKRNKIIIVKKGKKEEKKSEASAGEISAPKTPPAEPQVKPKEIAEPPKTENSEKSAEIQKESKIQEKSKQKEQE